MAFNHKRADVLVYKFWMFLIAFQPPCVDEDLPRIFF